MADVDQNEAWPVCADCEKRHAPNYQCWAQQARGADEDEPTSFLVYDPATGDDILVHVDEAPLWGRSEGLQR